jgi:hypothetical protein
MFSNCFLISEVKSEAQMPAASAAGKEVKKVNRALALLIEIGDKSPEKYLIITRLTRT